MKSCKKFLGLLLSVFMMISLSMPVFAVTAENRIVCDDGFVVLKKGASIDSENKKISKAKLVTTELNSMTQKEKEEIDEVVNNGTDVFIKCSISDDISKKIIENKSLETVTKSGCFIGWYIHNDGLGIEETPIHVFCMYEDGAKVSKDEYINDCLDIAINYEPVAEELYNDFGNNDSLNAIYENADESDKVKLQGIDFDTVEGYYFYDNIYYNAFGKSKQITLDNASSLSGYYSLGNAKLDLFIKSMGNRNSKNYDTMLVCTTVSGKDGSNYYVKKYSTTLGVSGCDIFSTSFPTSTTNEVVTVTFGTGFNSKGEVEYNSSISSSRNPDGQTFDFVTIDESSSKCYSTPGSVKRGKGWEMVASAWAATPVNSQAIFGAIISDLEIKNLVTYTLSSEELVVLVLIKNHTVLS